MSDVNKIFEINKKLQSFNLIKETEIALLNNEEIVVDLNRDQLLVGEESDGATRDYRSLAYAEMKRDMPSYAAPYPRANYYLTGSLQNQMKIQIMGVVWNIISEDDKFDEIVRKEGEELFILNEERKEIARSIVQEDLTKLINSFFE